LGDVGVGIVAVSIKAFEFWFFAIPPNENVAEGSVVKVAFVFFYMLVEL
jgi:hypothetical protein